MTFSAFDVLGNISIKNMWCISPDKVHYFKDGNGEITRLLMKTALIQDGVLPALIPPILRIDYIGLLEKAHEDDKPFIDFIAERELESKKDFLRLLQIPLPKLE